MFSSEPLQPISEQSNEESLQYEKFKLNLSSLPAIDIPLTHSPIHSELHIVDKSTRSYKLAAAHLKVKH